MSQPIFESRPDLEFNQPSQLNNQQIASLPVTQTEQIVDAVTVLQPMNATASIGLGTVGAVTVSLIVLGSAFALIKSSLRICQPNEILIVSGRKYKQENGKEVGYRVIFGGRAFVMPIIEQVEKMDMTTMPIPVEVKNSYAKGGTPLNIQAIATVKISSQRNIVGNAIERFLGRNRSEIERVVRETLEGNLRGVVANLTPEQVNEDRLNFAERIADDVARDLNKLGLHLDTLKVQSVTDDVDYLSSIGRRQIANIIRDAEIAEAVALGEAERIESDCQRRAEVFKSQALTIIQEKQNQLRKIKAELDQRSKSEEERTAAAAKEASARAEQQLQTVRAKLERLRLEAEQVLPAEAAREAQALYAKGAAAEVAENAKAAAEVNEMLAQVWKKTGRDATQIFLLQQIDMVLKEAATIPHKMHLQNINVIDNGDGKSIASLANMYPEVVRQFLLQIEQILGIDVAGTLSQRSAAVNGSVGTAVQAIPTSLPPAA
ncbi:MAG: flotillin [Phormidesmis priestleyi Ana]|uniref:Flotillin n=1 Tax=Phormidesmis priestleyi Ana TaxID=1666911 RepID=A0A0P7ZNV3_9CYAN|nr:MAG: flotillin [Phormidesmis priestleyi Ana]